MSESTGKQFLSVGETARLLGVHENTVRNWVASGTLVSARLPGARQHRFAREEVMRLLERRGDPASSIAPPLRADEPGLVSAMELDRWAAHQDSKGAFPELIRRLLALTPGISNIDIRAHEGVAAPGWDGSATSAGSSFLPSGELRFEFGTDQNPKSKAQKDYDKRVLALPADEDTTFVFATPRNWAGGRSWAAERTEEEKFRGGVKSIDAHVLEGWLQATPPAHYWISERLGYQPRGARTLAKWWDSFQGRVQQPIPASFFVAGRAAARDEILDLLRAANPTDAVATVKAAWRDDALAFLYAALESDAALAGRTLVVTEPSSWVRLVGSPQPMVLVPLFDDSIDFKAAANGGHRVVLIAGGDDVVRRGGAIELAKVDRVLAGESLREVGVDPTTADRMVALGRRSMPALFRSISRDARFANPSWVTDSKTATILAPLVLAGSWKAQPGDRAILEQLTGTSAADVDRLLKALARRSDAPFTLSGGAWRVTSPNEAAYLLLGELGTDDLERWRDVVLEVLLAEDPLSSMDTTARLAASLSGAAPTYSSTLQLHLARGLALAAATADVLPPSLRMQLRVDDIVRQLFERAASDPGGAVWARLAPFLPLLAEAAPEVFQDAVEVDLTAPAPILATLFRDADGDGDVFGPSSPHPNLLWALETLCWSPDHFGRAAGLLVQVARIDPGGRLSNRPLGSLREVTTGWIAHSGANVADKIAVLERALQGTPDVGWRLLLMVWPAPHRVAFPPHKPTYRDWVPTKQSVTYGDWATFVGQLVQLALSAAGSRADRWLALIPRIDDVPPRERAPIIEAFIKQAAAAGWTQEERYGLWDAFVHEIARHEEHPSAEWAMPPEELAPLKAAAAELAPAEDPRRFSKLFGWRAPVPGLKLGDDGYDARLQELQQNAIDEVLEQGLDRLEELIADVKAPMMVGNRLATMTNAPEDDLLAWLETDASNLREAALSYARLKMINLGVDWLRAALGSVRLSSEARESLMSAVPFSRAFWSEVDALDDTLSTAYWQRVVHYGVSPGDRADAVDLLLEHDRPWQAVGLLGDMVHESQDPDVKLIKRTLRALLVGSGPVEEPQMSDYYVGSVLEYLERTIPEDAELAGFEFAFFNFVDGHQPSRALYRTLGREPAEFVELIKTVYRGDGEAPRKLSTQEQAHASLAWSVLREWSTLPGLRDDGTIDGDHLAEWVRGARLALADLGRAAIGDEQIGQVLASSPPGADGVWPAEEVRDIVENLVNTRIETGLHIGRTNQRGVTTRGAFDGGDQERALEQEYRDMASRIATRWPRTARVLRGIADSYRQEADRNDAEAERRGDDG